MKKAEFKQFAVAWATTQKIYGNDQPPEVLSVIFRTLEPYSLADVEAALGAHMRDQDAGRFAPKPADIVRAIEGRTDSQVALAWAQFREATRSGDLPTDPTLQAVIRRMGGLEHLGDRTSRDLDFMRDQFAALWLASLEPQRLGIAGKRMEAIAQ